MNSSITDKKHSNKKLKNYNVKLKKRLEIPLGKVDFLKNKSYKSHLGDYLEKIVSISTNTSNIFFEMNNNNLYSLDYNHNQGKYEFIEILKGNIEAKIESMQIENSGNIAVLVSL